MQQKNPKTTGFTLIELLVVIAIIGLLSSVVLASLNSARAKARDARRLTDLNQISTALEMFYDQQGRYPKNSGGTCWDFCAATSHMRYFANCLEQGVNCGFTTTNFKPVMSEVSSDPLDNPSINQGLNYHYFTGWEGRGPECYILGALLEETNNPALNSDDDGDRRISGDNGCVDPYYCKKVNWPCS